MKVERTVNGRIDTKTVSDADGRKLIAKGWNEAGKPEKKPKPEIKQEEPAKQVDETSKPVFPKKTKRGRPPKQD